MDGSIMCRLIVIKWAENVECYGSFFHCNKLSRRIYDGVFGTMLQLVHRMKDSSCKFGIHEDGGMEIKRKEKV